MSRTFEEVHGVGPVGGTVPLDQPGPRGPGTLKTFRVINKRTGEIVIADEFTDLTDYDRLPGEGA